MPRTKQQELISSLTHGLAGLFAIIGAIVLIGLAASQRTPWHIVVFSIYSASLVLLYIASFVYHFVSAVKGFKKVLQSIDYTMITLLIAGTYTPITLITLRGVWGWTLFGIIWGITIASMVIRYFTSLFQGWIPATFYLIMGLIIVIAIKPLILALPVPALWLLFMGGFCYILGTGFFGLEKITNVSASFGLHELFHVFVILGSVAHFIMMYKYI